MPSITTAEQKAVLRNAVKEFYFLPAEKTESDKLLLSRFLSLPQVAESTSILLFYGVGDEPDTARLLEPLVRMDKIVALPRCLPHGRMEARRYFGAERLRPNAYGIPEPDEGCPVVKRDDMSLILVPNLCCDRRGFRLGRGGGYYDRYLAGFSGHTVALCRDRLLRAALPAEDHDVPVELVLTETESLSTPTAEKSGA